jgi:hypothetical protein
MGFHFFPELRSYLDAFGIIVVHMISLFTLHLPSKPLNHTTTQARHTMYLRSIGLVAHV